MPSLQSTITLLACIIALSNARVINEESDDVIRASSPFGCNGPTFEDMSNEAIKQLKAAMPHADPRSFRITYEDEESNKPHHGMRKRHILPDPDSECGTQTIYVDFKRLGWHHVIAPSRAILHFCGGSCKSSPTLSNKSSWSMIKHKKKYSNDYEKKERCCRSMGSEPLEVVYLTSTGMIDVGYAHGLVAQQCKCV